tara:strand:- start:806 stop:1570 length:765 start_codon:yes stop_codon:yes gene_type:complete
MESSNNVYLGDCLEVMPRVIKDKSIDMILCDLPYGTTNCKWDSPIDLEALWLEYNRVIKDNGCIALFAQTPFDKVLGCSNLKMLRYEWIWHKTHPTGHLNANRMPMKAHENILIFYKRLPTYNPIKTMGHKLKIASAKNRSEAIIRRNGKDNLYNNEYPDKVPSYKSTERFPLTIQTFPSDKQKSSLHKTQKPLDLIKYLIKTYTNEGDMILDNACGSGTTGVGARDLKRGYKLIEKELEFYNKTNNRLNGIIQ